MDYVIGILRDAAEGAGALYLIPTVVRTAGFSGHSDCSALAREAISSAVGSCNNFAVLMLVNIECRAEPRIPCPLQYKEAPFG